MIIRATSCSYNTRLEQRVALTIHVSFLVQLGLVCCKLRILWNISLTVITETVQNKLLTLT